MDALRRLYPTVASTLALLVALTGSAYAAGVLPRHSVGTKQLKSRSVTAAKLAPGAVGPLAPGSVGSGQVADGSITRGDLDGALAAAIDAGATSGSPLAVAVHNNAIQVIPGGAAHPFVTIGTLHLPAAGSWFAVLDLRAFPSATTPAHAISCSIPGTGPDMDTISGAAVDGLTYIDVSGIIKATGPTDLAVECRPDLNGNITVTFAMSALRVQTAG